MEEKPKKQNEMENAKSLSALIYKKRMLQWKNPVEYVNNMYGAHPNDSHMKYFFKVFKN